VVGGYTVIYMNNTAAPTTAAIAAAIATALGSLMECDGAAGFMEDEDFGAWVEDGRVVVTDDADVAAIAAFFADLGVELDA